MHRPKNAGTIWLGCERVRWWQLWILHDSSDSGDGGGDLWCEWLFLDSGRDIVEVDRHRESAIFLFSLFQIKRTTTYSVVIIFTDETEKCVQETCACVRGRFTRKIHNIRYDQPSITTMWNGSSNSQVNTTTLQPNETRSNADCRVSTCCDKCVLATMATMTTTQQRKSGRRQCMGECAARWSHRRKNERKENVKTDTHSLTSTHRERESKESGNSRNNKTNLPL